MDNFMVRALTHSLVIDLPVFVFLLECPNGHPYYVGEVRFCSCSLLVYVQAIIPIFV